jgi:PAS domain S-box-containing protein
MLQKRSTFIARDADQRAISLDELLNSREFFEGILDIAADAVISVDTAQRIVLFNQGAVRIFGYAPEEIVGKPLAELLPEDSRGAHDHHVGAFGNRPQPSRQMGERGRIRGRRKDGTIFPAEASISRFEFGGRTMFTAILRDVTPQREAEEAIKTLNADLRQRAALLEAANRELEAFSYSVSHDLRAPLRSISGFAQVLMEDFHQELDAEGQDYLRRIRDASQRMGQLIDDLLDLSRFTRGEISREDVDLSAIARGIASDLQGSQPERQAEFVIAPKLTAHADPRLVRTLLVNLIGNAWKYTSKHPSARIEFGSCRREDGRTVFFVKDDGAGFDMAYAHKLFGAFQRLHGMKDFPGTGVGLATVQRIVNKHGGEVWAEGEIEKGATFHFTLQ